ncbi:MAG: tRNA (uridine(34)/cytosine(34)/5-carboxymethylaminomethyluridine(34)-2'-O)-methyltransferase TrmL [Candidatus Marinimicrobia bacterium]|nr:tRNA (uridine(34)/cytosine(34)/5-carboxymethylaminomethyluridine(34)-2'-O)-methyltransferase TrmL [Candidatus Neomarinimicrobiota bacterium]|tara:strand:- start:15610 stop:16074 length:465 start_codon:yes stop_codon:yes gene_type:complete
MLTVVLYEPQIPPNTGNIGRLCAATETNLHIVGDIGFDLDNKKMKRAGLDYWKHINFEYYPDLNKYHQNMVEYNRFHLLTTKSPYSYTSRKFMANDFIVFGSETAGINEKLLKAHWNSTCTIPIKNLNIRSLNLANSVGIVVFEALRQIDENNI